MDLRCVIAALALAIASPSFAAPPPPLPPEEEGLLKNFVKALPTRIPEQVDSFSAVVSPDVKVYREGKLAYADRDSWFDYLRSFAGTSAAEPGGIAVSRESYFRADDGSIVALEFSYPIAPRGREGQIVYHPSDPLQFVSYHLERGRVVRVDYGPRMRSYDYLLRPAAAGDRGAGAPSVCPQQPEPPPLASAGFNIPTEGETLLFSAAHSFQSVRYALRVLRRPGAEKAWATLVRLQRRPDCNVHARAGNWDFELSGAEADAVFAAAASLERAGANPSDIVLDGTTVEVQRYASGKKAFSYASNGGAKEPLSNIVLEMLKRHVPSAELPTTADWRYKLPGSAL